MTGQVRKGKSRAQESGPLSVRRGREVVRVTTDTVLGSFLRSQGRGQSRAVRGLSLSCVTSHQDHCTVDLGAKGLASCL